MKTVREIAEEIVAREGGYVNDPDDPGGATQYGVTLHTLRRLGRDLNRDQRVTAADVRQLTKRQAAEIFLTEYFAKPGLANLPMSLQPSVFDMYVNAGANAVRVLQRLLTRIGWPLVADGKLGPKTLAAARQAASEVPQLADAYGVARRDYYYSLGDARPSSRKYCRRRDGGKGGWILRAEAFISRPLHLSEDQHRQRVAAWG